MWSPKSHTKYCRVSKKEATGTETDEEKDMKFWVLKAK